MCGVCVRGATQVKTGAAMGELCLIVDKAEAGQGRLPTLIIKLKPDTRSEASTPQLELDGRSR